VTCQPLQLVLQMIQCVLVCIGLSVCVKNGLTALHLASKEGHVYVVAELLRRDADIDIATKVGAVGPILSAVEDSISRFRFYTR